MRIKNPWPYGKPITVATRTQTGLDEFNQPIYTDRTVTVKGVFSLTETIEDGNGVGQVVDRPHVILPAGTAVDSNSTITVGGTVWQVDGSPQELSNAYTGWQAGIRVNLTTTAG